MMHTGKLITRRLASASTLLLLLIAASAHAAHGISTAPLRPWHGPGRALLANSTASDPHKDLAPLAPTDWITFVVAAAVLALAAGGGLGGGVVMVPLLILVTGKSLPPPGAPVPSGGNDKLSSNSSSSRRAIPALGAAPAGFATDRAAALSNATIMAGGLANFVLNAPRRRGNGGAAAAALIDWDLVMIMEPTTLVGALAGAYLNKASRGLGASAGPACLPGLAWAERGGWPAGGASGALMCALHGPASVIVQRNSCTWGAGACWQLPHP
jgi:hypothetical protein